MPPLLALLSVGAALTMAADELPLALRLAVVGLVALKIWLTVAIVSVNATAAGAAGVPVGTDPLTGLYGARAFEHELAAAKELGRDRSALFSSEVERVLHSAGGAAGTRQLRLTSLLALAEALDLRDHGDTAHSHTVARLAETTALELGLGREHAARVHLAGLLHDVGMIGVSPELPRHDGDLDDAGLAEIRTHPEVAAQLLDDDELADLRGWIEAHHERPDGGGYPHGLAGEEIPLEASILAVADAWEALTNDRPRRAALDEQAAAAELRAHAGTQFDATVVDAFLRALARESVPG